MSEFPEFSTNESFYTLLHLKKGSQDDLLIAVILSRIVFRDAVFKSKRNL